MMRIPNLVLAGALFVALVPASSGAVQTYKVKKGDTLYEVAHRFHLGVDELKGANGLEGNGLKPGQKLKIPSQKGEGIERSKRDNKEGGDRGRDEAVKVSKKEEKGAARRGEEPAGRGTDEREASRHHVVKKGDTLGAIARVYHVSLKDLKTLNRLGRRAKIKPGMELVVSKGTARDRREAGIREESYTVKKGDNLWRVARRFHLSASELKSLNGLHGDGLKPGQRLVVARHSVPVLESATAESVAECRIEDGKADAELKAASEEALAAIEEGESVGVTGRVIRVAKKMLGIPYRFGGSSARGIDCSAYVQKVFRFLNMPLPRTAREQYEMGSEIARGELATGDLVFFRTYARFPSHVGIYLGDNQFIHASSKGKRVTIDRLDEPFYDKRFIGAKRVVVDQEPEAPKVEEKANESDQSAG